MGWMPVNIIDAIKSRRPFRREGWPHAGQWIVLERGDLSYGEANVVANWSVNGHFMTALDLMLDDWEIQEPTVTITRTQYAAAATAAVNEADEALSRHGGHPSSLWIAEFKSVLARKLGLGEP